MIDANDGDRTQIGVVGLCVEWKDSMVNSEQQRTETGQVWSSSVFRITLHSKRRESTKRVNTSALLFCFVSFRQGC